MKKILLILAVIITACLSSCSSDKSGDYLLVDLSYSGDFGPSQKSMERDRAKAIGSLSCHIEKVGDYYKWSTSSDPDELLFKKDGNGKYSCHDGQMTLKFTSNGAIIEAHDGGKSAIWTFEKQ